MDNKGNTINIAILWIQNGFIATRKTKQKTKQRELAYHVMKSVRPLAVLFFQDKTLLMLTEAIQNHPRYDEPRSLRTCNFLE